MVSVSLSCLQSKGHPSHDYDFWLWKQWKNGQAARQRRSGGIQFQGQVI
jgi:hypothetical protein